MLALVGSSKVQLKSTFGLLTSNLPFHSCRPLLLHLLTRTGQLPSTAEVGPHQLVSPVAQSNSWAPVCAQLQVPEIQSGCKLRPWASSHFAIQTIV